MNEGFTVDSMIKEIKSSLSKYETMLKSYETNPSPKQFTEITSMQKAIEKNIRMVQPIAVKEEHKYLLSTYLELHTELHTRLNQAQMKLKPKNSSLFADDPSNLKNTANMSTLSEENALLKEMIKSSNEIRDNTDLSSTALADQEKGLGKINEQNIKILKKIPLIDTILGNIKFHHIKEKLIIGMVIGLIVVLGVYLTFYR